MPRWWCDASCAPTGPPVLASGGPEKGEPLFTKGFMRAQFVPFHLAASGRGSSSSLIIGSRGQAGLAACPGVQAPSVTHAGHQG